MRNWNLPVKPPLTFTLAADPRLGATDCFNDHIWSLSMGGGEPPAVALETTFGLRARSFRIFPRFTEETLSISDPEKFSVPVAVQAFYPNYVCLTFEPLPELRVTAEYWTPASQVVAGKFKLENRADHLRQIGLELIANLSPSAEGQRMFPLEMNAVTVLTGSTDGLQPVLFMSAGPQADAGVYPFLRISQDFSSRQSREYTWVQAALPTAEESFDLARQTAARNWPAEVARLELLQDGQIEVYTGDPKWDFALAYAQKVALGLLIDRGAPERSVSFVLSRDPDQGYSPRGDGSDLPILWSGQTPWDCAYLLSYLLPAAPEIGIALLRNFLATQGADGFVDWKPGLGEQRSQVWATPMLASLAEQIYRIQPDQGFLAESFPQLLAFFQGWMSQHDRDGDGIPEWDHPIQTGYDDHPLFTRWHDWSQGVEISTVEGPDLCALLYRESQALLNLARVLGRQEARTALQGFAENMSAAVEAAWDADDQAYHYWDRESHQWSRSQFLGEWLGPGELLIERTFEKPVRLLADIDLSPESGRTITVFVDGESISGQQRLERVETDDFRWRLERGHFTGQRVYRSIHRIEIQGIGPEDRVSLHTVGLRDLTQSALLPLWAGLPDSERAGALVQQTILAPEKFWGDYGIRADLHADPSSSALGQVHMPWNQLIGEGLLAYGYRAEAAELVMHLMAAAIDSLNQYGAFRRYYDPLTSQGKGERNCLPGLPPFKLFLDALGVKIHSPWKVSLDGCNPFPWSVTLKYRGLTILRQAQKTTVIFPDGQTVVVDDPQACTVSNEFYED